MIDEVKTVCTQPIDLILSPTDRAQILHCFTHHFAAINKRPVDNLDQLVKAFQNKMAQLAMVITFSYQYGDAVGRSNTGWARAHADGEAGQTLNQMRNGTLWFDGWKNLDYEVLCVLNE
jgi:hypothetical protein